MKKLTLLLILCFSNILIADMYSDWNITDLDSMVVLIKYSDDKLSMLNLGVSQYLGDNLQISSIKIEDKTIFQILYNDGTSKAYDLSQHVNPYSVIVMGNYATTLINALYNAHTVKLYCNDRLMHTFQLKNLTELLNRYR